MENIMSESTGQKLTEEHNWHCIKCDVVLSQSTNWSLSFKRYSRYLCKDCDYIQNSNRMYVDNKYIPMSHPLHKSGRYKGFTDAAFSSLENYAQSLEGEVYIIYNPSFPSWIKVGMAVDSQDRLKQYQTGSPYRDYTVHASYSTPNRREAEAEAHRVLGENHERRGEWFVCAAPIAKNLLDNYFRGKQLELF